MLPFTLPPPLGCSVPPKWDGKNFVIGDKCAPVLEYSENFAGWSDDLTALHEEAARDNHPIDLASRNDAVRQVEKFGRTVGSVIMEIGCSSGFLIRDLVKIFPEAVVLGADVVKEPLYQLAKSLPSVPLIRFDLLKCPLPDQSIDVLIMLNVLEHIENDGMALNKVFKLLKPGGVLIIEVPSGPSLYDAYDEELHHFRRYSAVELRQKLIKSGFHICRESHLGFLLYPAFAVVKLLNKTLLQNKNKAVVRNQVRKTSNSNIMLWALEFETKYLNRLRLPFGIRVLMSAQRPV
ncbi:putative generic methyltransferase [Methyloglobulus morosus KoM1]|uniref:Putative generic methyltransferase n=1 Tax=Methyloglobulus morosus KoM1 TaxID=1116472 RepID=V5C4C1_9GAMM|nr:class I SAM-dependent methyltransferase [Methyloglobulus morosus]ESS71603.1 putative generic methyltransferase [Methyloglobulus morosus KoM1]